MERHSVNKCNSSPAALAQHTALYFDNLYTNTISVSTLVTIVFSSQQHDKKLDARKCKKHDKRTVTSWPVTEFVLCCHVKQTVTCSKRCCVQSNTAAKWVSIFISVKMSILGGSWCLELNHTPGWEPETEWSGHGTNGWYSTQEGNGGNRSAGYCLHCSLDPCLPLSHFRVLQSVPCPQQTWWPPFPEYTKLAGVTVETEKENRT